MGRQLSRILAWLVALLTPVVAFAQEFNANATKPDNVPYNTLGEVIEAVFRFAIIFAGIAFMILFLQGGLAYLTGSGDAESVKKARGTLVNSIVGLIVVLAAWAIGTFVLDKFGVSINTTNPNSSSNSTTNTNGNTNNTGFGKPRPTATAPSPEPTATVKDPKELTGVGDATLTIRAVDDKGIYVKGVIINVFQTTDDPGVSRLVASGRTPPNGQLNLNLTKIDLNKPVLIKATAPTGSGWSDKQSSYQFFDKPSGSLEMVFDGQTSTKALEPSIDGNIQHLTSSNGQITYDLYVPIPSNLTNVEEKAVYIGNYIKNNLTTKRNLTQGDTIVSNDGSTITVNFTASDRTVRLTINVAQAITNNFVLSFTETAK